MDSHHHHHHHGHGHYCQGHDHSHDDLAEKNKVHFDNVAGSIFDTPWIKALCDQISNEVQTQFEWFGLTKKYGGEIRMLDYACGNGVVSRALIPFVSTIRGMDISANMVTQYNKLASENKHPETKMHAVVGNLLDDVDVPEGFETFDLIVMSMALHHVADPDLMIRKLSQRLVEGGVLVIVDWVSHAESGCEPPKPLADSPVKHTVSKHGFTEGEVKAGFEEAGLEGWGWRWFAERSKLPAEFGGEHQLFLARGRKQGVIAPVKI